RLQRAAAKGVDHGLHALCRDAHDADRAAAGGGGDGGDGLVESGEHGAIVVAQRKSGRRPLSRKPWVPASAGMTGGQVFFALKFGKLNCGGTPMRTLISHCCAIDRMLFV